MHETHWLQNVKKWLSLYNSPKPWKSKLFKKNKNPFFGKQAGKTAYEIKYIELEKKNEKWADGN